MEQPTADPGLSSDYNSAPKITGINAITLIVIIAFCIAIAVAIIYCLCTGVRNCYNCCKSLCKSCRKSQGQETFTSKKSLVSQSSIASALPENEAASCQCGKSCQCQNDGARCSDALLEAGLSDNAPPPYEFVMKQQYADQSAKGAPPVTFV